MERQAEEAEREGERNMKFRIKVCPVNDPAGEWWEDYDEDISDPEEWAKATVERFNNTSRPGSCPRKLLAVEIMDAESIKDHKWDKDIQRMSVSDHLGNYDGMTCRRCRITGKRFGLQGVVTLDSKWRAKVYARCDTAKAHLDKKRQDAKP